jgi:hypothetical protein
MLSQVETSVKPDFENRCVQNFRQEFQTSIPSGWNNVEAVPFDTIFAALKSLRMLSPK